MIKQAAKRIIISQTIIINDIILIGFGAA